jgi:dephospho-CoA kinase
MLRVGLTGNIASGKSQASLVFAELGAHIIDADVIAHELLRPGTPTYAKVVQAFGEDILLPNGNVDRKKLGQIVFNSSSQRFLLNSLVHADVRGEVFRRIADLEATDSRGIVIVEAALLVETGGYRLFDCLVVVTCDPALQVERIVKRDGLTEPEARVRMAAQMPAEEKLRVADYAIDTSSTFEETRRQAKAIHLDLLRREQETRSSSSIV